MHRSPEAPALLVIATLVLLSACKRAEESPTPEIRPVRTVKIEQRAAGDTVTLTGTVQAQTEVNLSFRIDGRLIERGVSVGDAVRPGQLIARLDPQNEDSALQGAQAQLTAARARLAEARSNFERMRDLVADNAVSRSTFEQAETLQKTAESQVEAAQSQVALAANRLSYTRLVADVAGVVTAQGAEPGEVVGPGRMIVQVAREGGRDAVFDLPARGKESTSLDTVIDVALTANSKVTAKAVVREIAPRADPLTGTFRIRARINNPPAAMRLGTTVTGRIKLAATETIEIPPSALVRSDRQAAVWVVDPRTSVVAMRTIEIRSSDPNRVEVAAGLNPGDVIVTAGVQALRPGQKVSLLGAKR